MSILIEYENGQLKTAELMYERTTPSPAYQCEDGKTFCIGDLFGKTFEDICKTPWGEDPNVLNEVVGTKALARADVDGCTFAVDMNGIDTFFYYHTNTRFILSDNFWDIVKRIQPTYEDLDIPELHRTLLCYSTTGRTFIKNLNILMPSRVGRYDAGGNILSIRKYRDFRYTNEVSSVFEAVEHMDTILRNSMKLIREKYGDVQYGVGISGGLDSRLIPHYAKEQNLRLTGFKICIPRPHGILRASDSKTAEEVARIFQIPFCNAKWNIDRLREKLHAMTQHAPLVVGGNAFKYEPDAMPDYQVLLTGGSGMVVGAEIPKGIQNLQEEELASALLQEFLPNHSATFSHRARRALTYLFGIQFKPDSSIGELLLQFVGDDALKAVKQEIIDFVHEGKHAGKSNIDIYEDYFANVCGFMNRYGAYESILGTKRAVSIYIPFLFEETLRWTPELLQDRAALNALILDKVPEVAGVKSETFYVAPQNRAPHLFEKAWGLSKFLIRGNGGAVDQYSFRRHRIRKMFMDDMNSTQNSWFHQAFGLTDTVINEQMILNSTARIAATIWQLKHTIDCIEHKEYLNF